LWAALLGAQTAPVPSNAADPLGRSNPQASMLHFLEACHAHDYFKATRYMDLRQMPAAERTKRGIELAQQLEDLLDDTPFDIATLSRDPEGDQSDGLGAAFEHLATFHVDGQTLDLQLERVELRPGLQAWLVSAPSVALIPAAHKVVAESGFEKDLPQPLVTFEILDTPVWRWIALIVMGAALWYLAGAITWVLLKVFRPGLVLAGLRGPVRFALLAAGFRLALELAPPASLSRLVIERAIALAFFLAVAWAAAVVIDYIADRWHSHLDPRVQAVSYSVLPLGRQVLKLTLYLVAVLSVFSAWGYNTSTILAGLGVGGLAVALAAQKTIENLFGGVSVIGDRPVLVGDVCRFGDRTGTVMHIGLRSTRIRTQERTIISVPNGQFAAMTLENISGRDKILFHPVLKLRRATTSDQLSQVLGSFREVLAAEPRVELGALPVRFIGIGDSSFDIEIFVYVTTEDYNEFLGIQQELLLKLMAAVEKAGTGLAVPLQETFVAAETSDSSGGL
jgi:MscS family membrane protein